MAQECLDDIKACNEQPIGNGPYEFAEAWKHNQSITLKKYADYTDDATAGLADEITFKIYADLKTAYRDFQAGDLDIVDAATRRSSRRPGRQYPDQILEVDSGSFAYFGFPLYEKDFQDVRDPPGAVDGDRPPGDHRPRPRRPLHAGHRRDPAASSRAAATTPARPAIYDPEEAKTALRRGRRHPGQQDQHLVQQRRRSRAVGAGRWPRAGRGPRPRLRVQVAAVHALPRRPGHPRAPSTGPYRLGWAPDYPSPQNYLDPIYGAGSSNYGDWKGPEHDEFLDLVAEGDAAPTVEEGLPSYQAAADVVLDNQVVIPLWFGKTFIVFSEKIQNLQYSPTDQMLLTEVSRRRVIVTTAGAGRHLGPHPRRFVLRPRAQEGMAMGRVRRPTPAPVHPGAHRTLFLLHYMTILSFQINGNPVRALFGDRQPPPETIDGPDPGLRPGRPLPRADRATRASACSSTGWAATSRGDFGVDFNQQPVIDLIARAAPITLRLTFLAIVFETVVGILAGVLAGLRKDRFADNFVRVATVLAISVPIFVLGVLTQIIFGLYIGNWVRDRGAPDWVRGDVLGLLQARLPVGEPGHPGHGPRRHLARHRRPDDPHRA